MKSSVKSKSFWAVAAVALVLLVAASVYAGWGPGWAGGWGAGAGWMHRGYMASGFAGNWNNEDFARINREREAFFKDTADLRENLYQKQLELQSELAKPQPDAKKAEDLQKEISDLRARLDQKRLEHRVRLQKENPQFFSGRGFGGGYGPMGMARGFHGRGMGMGFGGRGGGCRW